MKFDNWKIERISDIIPEDFFSLINANEIRLKNTFPVTLSKCSSLNDVKIFLDFNSNKEKEKEGYFFYIRNLESGKLIGYLGIKSIDSKISKCELFYLIDKEFEGKGIISAAVSKIIEFCFKELEMNKIFICTSKINFGSQKIALKHNFTKEGLLREEFKNGDGNLEDIVYFGLLKTDYYEK